MSRVLLVRHKVDFDLLSSDVTSSTFQRFDTPNGDTFDAEQSVGDDDRARVVEKDGAKERREEGDVAAAWRVLASVLDRFCFVVFVVVAFVVTFSFAQ